LKDDAAQSKGKTGKPARMILGSLILRMMSLAGSSASRDPDARAMNLDRDTSAVPRTREAAPTRSIKKAMIREGEGPCPESKELYGANHCSLIIGD